MNVTRREVGHLTLYTDGDGVCSVSDNGTWLPGVFTSEAIALAWAKAPHQALADAWDASRPTPIDTMPSEETE